LPTSSLVLYSHRLHRDRHSVPTRRSSDLVAEKLTSSPALSNSPSSMPTITGRSNTGLLGAIFTTGRVAEAMISPYGADADRILRPSLAAQPVPMSAS